MSHGDDESKRHGAERHEGAAHSSPYPVSRLGAVQDLVDVAREIQKADTMLVAVAGNQLEQIASQIRGLQEQARQVLERARRDAELHRARCNFQKRAGKTYHLYRDPQGRLYFSMLSPADWKNAPPDAFEGSYRLEADASFTPADEAEARDRQRLPLGALLPSRDGDR